MPTEEDALPIVAYLAIEEKNLVERFNDDFADTILMVTRNLTDHAAATSSTIIAIDPAGIDCIVTDPTGEHPSRIEFGVPVEVPDHLTTALIDLMERARLASGEEGQTAAEREATALAQIGTHLTEVVAVTDITPHLRQVTFGGGDLATTFRPNGPDCFFYLLLPPPGRTELTIDRSFTWEAHALMPAAEQPVGNYYTVRHWRPEQAELDAWMVLHDDLGEHAGPASTWAAQAKPGDPVALWGPRTVFHPPEGTDRLVLVADETALPGIAGILESLPEGMPATVIAEVADEGERQPLPERADLAVTWVHRDGAPAGTTTLLVDAVRALAPFEGTPYVYGGGETKAMTAVRRHVRDERGLAREAVMLNAYWRHRTTTDADVEPEGYGG